MKIAVISDCHSNIIALNDALNDAKKNNVEKYIFLGDYITDGEDSNDTLDIVKKVADYLILGNREKYILNYDDSKRKFNNYKPIANTYNNLREDNINYIKTLKTFEIININNYKILMIHGDTYKNNSITMMFDKIIEQHEDFDICLFGHTHQYLDMKYKGRRFINPGSIGIPTDYPTYKYCIIDITDKVTVELREFKTDNSFNYLKEKYLNTNYYKENPIWSDLLLKSIKDGQNYCSIFIKLINSKISNTNINVDQFNTIWNDAYIEFCKNYNELDFLKFNELLSQNKIYNIKLFFEFCKSNFNDRATDKNYYLLSPIQLLENKSGNSWDKVELYRKFFNRYTYKIETYFSYYNINDKDIISYSILVYYDREKVYWFEPTFNKIYEYLNIDSLLRDFKYKFLKSIKSVIKEKNYHCYLYNEPKYHIDFFKYYTHCINGKKMY